MKKFKIFLIIAVFGLAVGACDYAFVVPEEVPEIPTDEDLSFSEVVLPIFKAQCASCHKPGGQALDLTEANAYQNINTSKYINLDNPGSSLIYSYVAPGASTHKHKQYTPTQAQYILVWIEQGAQNN